MIQFRLVLLGVTVIASLGYAIYKHYQDNQEPHFHSYGRQQDPGDDYFPRSPPSTSNSSQSERPRKRKKPTSSQCTICLVNIRSYAEDVKHLECGHVFHQHCIQVWFNTQKTCPNCRTPAR